MSLKKDKQKVLGEVFDEARIKTFLNFEAPTGVNHDLKKKKKAYRGMKAENFDTFLTFFLEAGLNINATNPAGQTLLKITEAHRHGEDYATALKKHGAE